MSRHESQRFFLSNFFHFLFSFLCSASEKNLHKFGNPYLFYIMSILFFKYRTLLPNSTYRGWRETHWGLSVEFISCHRIFKRRITVLSSNFTWNNPRAFPPKREDRVPFGFTRRILSRGKSRFKAQTTGSLPSPSGPGSIPDPSFLGHGRAVRD